MATGFAFGSEVLGSNGPGSLRSVATATESTGEQDLPFAKYLSIGRRGDRSGWGSAHYTGTMYFAN